MNAKEICFSDISDTKTVLRAKVVTAVESGYVAVADTKLYAIAYDDNFSEYCNYCIVDKCNFTTETYAAKLKLMLAALLH